MAKKIGELQNGDTIYKVLDEDRYYVPKILKCKVNGVGKNGVLDFPDHCRVYYVDPRLPEKETSVALGGNDTVSYNGALYYSDKDEAYTRYKDSVLKSKEELIERRNQINKYLEELENDWNNFMFEINKEYCNI